MSGTLRAKDWGSCCECHGVWKGSDGLSVIHPNSRQHMKALREVSFKKTLIYCSHWAQSGKQVRSSGKIQRKSGPNRKVAGPETWDTYLTLEKLELSDSPELPRHAEAACSVEDTESPLLEDHAEPQIRPRQCSSLSQNPPHLLSYQ